MPDLSKHTGFEYLFEIVKLIINQPSLSQLLTVSSSFIRNKILYWSLIEGGYARIDPFSKKAHLIEEPSDEIVDIDLVTEDVTAYVIADEITEFYLHKQTMSILKSPMANLFIEGYSFSLS